MSRLDQNPDLQRRELEAAGCDKIIIEHGSGAKRDRPGLQEALLQLRPGDVFTVWKVDRASRSLVDLVELAESLQSAGVDFRSLHDPIDTTSAMGKAFYGICGVFAQLERDLIIERTNAGLAAAAAKGHRGGRRRKLYGAKLARAKAMDQRGEASMKEIAAMFGVSEATAYRYVRNNGVSWDHAKNRRVLELHGSMDAFMAATEDPSVGRNPARRVS